MHLPERASVIRIYIGETDRHDRRLLHEAIVEEARRRGMAGATVTRGIMGFGANSRIHTERILRLSENLPVVVEIVDTPEHVEEFLPWLDGVVESGLVLVEETSVRMYLHGERES